MEETRRTITMEELETIMTEKSAVFDACSVDTYGMSIDMLCTGCRFEKTDGSEYLAMILVNEPTEVQMDASYIEEIYLDEEGTITIEFNVILPDLEIKYRE